MARERTLLRDDRGVLTILLMTLLLLAIAIGLVLLWAAPALAQDDHGGSTAHSPEMARDHQGSEHAFPHGFEDADHWADVFDDPDRDAWQRPDEVIRAMAIEPGMTVADLGAGTGYFLPHLSPAVGPDGAVLGLDIEENLVEHMQQRAEREGLANVSAHVVAPDDPSLQTDSVDRILIVNTWHHIGDRNAYAAKLAEALTPGGAVFIVDYTMESDHGPPASHRLTPVQVERELQAGGLTTETIEESLPEQYIVVGWNRQ